MNANFRKTVHILASIKGSSKVNKVLTHIYYCIFLEHSDFTYYAWYNTRLSYVFFSLHNEMSGRKNVGLAHIFFESHPQWFSDTNLLK